MKEINLANKKVSPVAWVPTLYFAMGMPFVVLNMVLSLLYKDLGIGNAEITFWTGLIMLPWTLKFLWSPLLELYKTKKFFVVLTQIVSGVVFGLAAISLHLPDFFAISIALFAVVALSGATHDIAADGTYMGVLSKEDQARWIGWQGAFYNIAKIFATGLLVWIAGIITPMVGVLNAWTSILVFLCVVMTALGIYHYFILPTDGKHNDDKKSASETLKELWDVLKEFVQKAHIIYYILFIIIYRLAEGFVMKVVPLFLHDPVSQGGLGLSNEQIGTYYGTFGAAAFVLYPRRQRHRALRSEAGAVCPRPYLQPALPGLYLPCHLPAQQPLAHRRRHRDRVFRLRIWLRGPHHVYDAPDSSRQEPDVPLCHRLGYYEPQRDGHRYVERQAHHAVGL